MAEVTEPGTASGEWRVEKEEQPTEGKKKEDSGVKAGGGAVYMK